MSNNEGQVQLKDQVCTFDQGKRLKELGVTRSSIHVWNQLKYPANDNGDFAKNRAHCLITPTGDNLDRFIMHYINNENASFHWDEGTHDGGYDHSRCELDGEDYPAFNVAELGAMLPDGFGFYVYPGYSCKMSIIKFEFNGAYSPAFAGVPDFRLETEAQSRAALIIHLIENNLIPSNQAIDSTNK